MKKNIIILVGMLSVLALTTGCTKTTEEPINSEVNNVNSNTGSLTEKKVEDNRMWEEKFNAATKDDLAVGQKIMVMGEQNSDGSVVAERIIILQAGESFDSFQQMMRPDNNTSGEDNSIRSDGDRPTPSDMSERIQNMSEEERQVMREQKMAERGIKNDMDIKSRALAQAGTVGINGDILDIVENSLTLKLAGGGSKLVYFTDETNFLQGKSADDQEDINNTGI